MLGTGVLSKCENKQENKKKGKEVIILFICASVPRVGRPLVLVAGLAFSCEGSCEECTGD